jgi:hypothetical protein
MPELSSDLSWRSSSSPTAHLARIERGRPTRDGRRSRASRRRSAAASTSWAGPSSTAPNSLSEDSEIPRRDPTWSATVCRLTAKEKLQQTIEDLSEAEAQDALGFIVRRRGQRDALGEMLESAPLDDEPTTPEEDEGAREARAEIASGDVLSADEIRREAA